MERVSRRNFVTIGAGVAGLLSGLGGTYVLLYADMNRLRQKVKLLEARNLELENLVSSTRESLDATQKEIQVNQSQISKLKSERKDLQEQVSSYSANLSEIEKDLKTKKVELQDNVTRLQLSREQFSRVERSLKVARNSITALDADRLLLNELRKDLPREREEAQEFWKRVGELAPKSDPSLSGFVDRILERLHYYFDWLESLPDDPSIQDFCKWIASASSRALAYQQEIEKFQKEVLLIAGKHIAAIIEVAGSV